MSDPVTCHNCAGNGWIPVQVCCGNPVVGAEYMGAQESICCGDPEVDMETCPACKGSGEAPRLTSETLAVPSASDAVNQFARNIIHDVNRRDETVIDAPRAETGETK